MEKTDFQTLFNPTTVAIIGVNKNPLGGLKYHMALKHSGFDKDEGKKIFLINPKYAETGLMGEKVYSSIADPDLPKPIDLAIISIPAKKVPSLIKEMNNIVKFAVIYSSGFGESNKESLDRELRKAIASVNTRFIGPNCLGILSPYNKVSIYPKWDMHTGSISYISQSGGTMARLYIYLGSIGLGFSNVVSIGNAYDVTISELMEHFLIDEKTHTIALYLESIPNGRKFFQLTKEISKKKPIVLFKGGQTDTGVKATFSHTGGLAGSYKVWSSLAKQNGILLADHFELFADMIQVANIRPIPPKNLNVCILVAGGGIGVEFTDNFEKQGLNVVELQPKTQEALAKTFPDVNTNFSNPIDLGEYGYVPSLFSKAMKIVLKDENVGSVVFVREPERFPIISANLGIEDPGGLTIRSLSRILRKVNKPIFCNPSTNSQSIEAYDLRKKFGEKMIEAGIPVINYFTNIPKILKQMYNYGKFLNSQENT